MEAAEIKARRNVRSPMRAAGKRPTWKAPKQQIPMNKDKDKPSPLMEKAGSGNDGGSKKERGGECGLDWEGDEGIINSEELGWSSSSESRSGGGLLG